VTTRRKLTLCAGLLALASGVPFVWQYADQPRIELRFVRYSGDGAGVLWLTNRARHPIAIFLPPTNVTLNVRLDGNRWSGAPFFVPEHRGMELIATPLTWPGSTPQLPTLPSSISLQWMGMPSRSLIDRNTDMMLRKMGVTNKSTGEVSVNLPPR
jgi:hypothetical protein